MSAETAPNFSVVWAGDLSCEHQWDYQCDYDWYVYRACEKCLRRETMMSEEALDNDEWREHVLRLVDPRAE